MSQNIIDAIQTADQLCSQNPNTNYLQCIAGVSGAGKQELYGNPAPNSAQLQSWCIQQGRTQGGDYQTGCLYFGQSYFGQQQQQKK